MLACLVAAALAACGGTDWDRVLAQDANASTRLAASPESAGAAAPEPSQPEATTVAAADPKSVTTKPAASGSAAGQVATNWVDTFVNDMKLWHDGPARTLQWIRGWGSGWEYPQAYPKPAGWTSATPWGVITGDTNHSNAANPPVAWRVPGPYTGNQAPNTRVQVRDIQLWWLKSNGQWILGTYDPAPGGAAYHASWQGDVNMPGDVRSEDSNGGGVSIRYINYGSTYGEYLYHIWGSRPQVPDGYVGFASAYFARKILHDPKGVDDRASARLMAQVAGDWWSTPTARWDNFKTNEAMGFNRFKYLSNEWQVIAFHSLTEAQLRANPPPIKGL